MGGGQSGAWATPRGAQRQRWQAAPARRRSAHFTVASQAHRARRGDTPQHRLRRWSPQQRPYLHLLDSLQDAGQGGVGGHMVEDLRAQGEGRGCAWATGCRPQGARPTKLAAPRTRAHAPRRPAQAPHATRMPDLSPRAPGCGWPCGPAHLSRGPHTPGRTAACLQKEGVGFRFCSCFHFFCLRGGGGA